jgi:hypothetical protein
MSHFIPNTLVSVFRDGTPADGEDAWGYPAPPESPTPAQADVKDLPAFLSDAGQRTSQPASGQQTVVHRYRLRLRPGAVAFPLDVLTRVLDQRSGLYYQVDEVPQPDSTAQAADIRLVLRRVS